MMELPAAMETQTGQGGVVWLDLTRSTSGRVFRTTSLLINQTCDEILK
jgi:hypothetical protein